jgi:ribonuclease HI
MEYFYKKIIPIVSDSKNMKKKLEKFFKTYWKNNRWMNSIN